MPGDTCLHRWGNRFNLTVLGSQYYDRFIASETAVPYRAEAEDLYDDEFIEMIVKKTGASPRLTDLHPRQKDFMTVFPAFGIKSGHLQANHCNAEPRCLTVSS
jgi:hypothetical protein